MSEEKKQLVNGDQDGQSHGKAEIEKARIRMIAEGYKYKALSETLSPTSSEDSSLDTDPDTIKRKAETKWNKLHRRFLCIMVVTLLIIALLAGVVVWQHLSKNFTICTSNSCVKTSAYITGKMDTSVDPCEDFYQYTCGNWEKTTNFPDSRGKYNIFSEIEDKNSKKVKEILEQPGALFEGNFSTAIQKAKVYFNTCMDEDTIASEGIQPALELIKSLGSWTVTSANGVHWDKDSWNLMDAVVASHRLDFGPLFSMFVSPDDKNSSTYIIQFEQSSLSLASREEYFANHSNHNSTHDAFLKYSTKVGAYLGGNDTAVASEMKKVYELETKLAYILYSREELLDPEKTYHKMTVKEFQEICGPRLDIKLYLSKMFKRDIPDSEEILVPTPEYFRKLGPIIQETEPSTMANFIVWYVISRVVSYLPSKFADAYLILLQAESGVTKYDPRWQRCVDHVNSVFGFATSAIYVQRYFAKESRAQVETIVDEIRNAYMRSMPTVGWMDSRTRGLAEEKASAMEKMIGYPDWMIDTVRLDEYYANITITDGKFLKSYLSCLDFLLHKNLKKLGTVPDRTQWHMFPVETNAYYTPSYNLVVFPAGILQVPFYSPDFPMSFNFGTTGMIIGHEMTHGFDNQGRHYDKYGNLNNWWTNQSAVQFSAHSKCMVDQYSNYTAAGIHVKGERVLSENIADNGGLKTAYTAYKNWQKSHDDLETENYPGMDFTPEQLFFIGFGQLWCAHYKPEYAKQSILNDPHTISKYRTIGVVSNSGDFARAFNCPPNSKMNPQRKCQVW